MDDIIYNKYKKYKCLYKQLLNSQLGGDYPEKVIVYQIALNNDYTYNNDKSNSLNLDLKKLISYLKESTNQQEAFSTFEDDNHIESPFGFGTIDDIFVNDKLLKEKYQEDYDHMKDINNRGYIVVWPDKLWAVYFAVKDNWPEKPNDFSGDWNNFDDRYAYFLNKESKWLQTQG